MKVWDATESEGSEVFDRHLGSYASVAFSHDGRLLARSELGGGKTTVWDAHTWTRLADIPQRLSGFSPDGKLLATTSESKTLTFWDLAQKTPTLGTSINLPAVPFGPPVFSADNKYLALVSLPDTSAVGIWDVAGRSLVTKLADDQDRAETTEYAFSSDGRWFASGYKNGNIRLWNPQTWSRERLLIGNTQNVHALAFSPDSRWLAVGGDDAAVRLWSLDGEPSATILRGDTGAVFSLAFTADGGTVAVGSVDGTVKFWNIKARREVVTIKAHDSAVCAIAFSPGGSTMATASVDLTMRLWKAPGFDETDR